MPQTGEDATEGPADAALCRGRRRHQVIATRPAVATPAANRSNGGANVTLANGSPAAVCTISTRIRRITQPGAATTAPRIDGAPTPTARPPDSATMPAAIAGATSGTTSRFTIGDRVARRPK